MMSRFTKGLALALTFVGLILLFVLGDAWRTMEGGDAPVYNQLAVNLLQHGVFSRLESPIEPSLYRLPGYPLFLAAIYLVTDYSKIAVKIVQFILFGGIVFLAYGFVQRIADRRTARLAAVLCAIHFPFIFFVPLLITEILTSFLVVATVGVILVSRDYSGRRHLILCYAGLGLLLGILTLVRPSFSLLILPLAFAILLERKAYSSVQGFRAAAGLILLVGIGYAVVLGPWLARNFSVANRVVLSSASSESFYWSIRQYKGTTNYNLWQQWHSQFFPKLEQIEARAEDRLLRAEADPTVPRYVAKELLVEEEWRHEARAELEGLSVTDVVTRIPSRILSLWAPSYIYAPDWLYVRMIQRLPQIQGWTLLGAALFGVWLRRRSFAADWPLWMIPVYITAIHLVFHHETRYSVPGHVFMIVYAAVGLLWLFDWLKPRAGKPLSK